MWSVIFTSYKQFKIFFCTSDCHLKKNIKIYVYRCYDKMQYVDHMTSKTLHVCVHIVIIRRKDINVVTV